MSYDNTNRWTLNKNTDKQSDTHADYKGKINVNGVEYWLNGWIKDGPNGKFISGTIKLKDNQPRAIPVPPEINQRPISERAMPRRPDPISNGRPPRDDLDDAIPF